jgi:hypothetical protein
MNMKKLISLIVLMFTLSVRAETIIIPVSDLIYEIPNYKGPTLNLNSAINGQYSIGEIQKTKRDRKAIEKKLIDIAWEYYPDAKSIKLINGNFIIKCPDT